jgi:hypothetical protein
LGSTHFSYFDLAARIAINNLYKQNYGYDFAATIARMYHYHNPKNGKHCPIVSKEVYDIVQNNKEKCENVLIKQNDYKQVRLVK